VTGSGDSELKVWKINREVPATGLSVNDSKIADNPPDSEVSQVIPGRYPHILDLNLYRGFVQNRNVINFYGHVCRQSNERVISVRFHPRANLLAVHGQDKYIEIFRLRSSDEIKAKLARRKKRRQQAKRTPYGDMQVDDEEEEQIQAEHEIVPHQVVRTTAKVRSIDFMPVEQNQRLGEIQVPKKSSGRARR
jgi:U3 small nucleolar RNA-associated protein 12